MLFKFLSLVVTCGWFFSADAFVENVTHGYQSCRACHMSPSGGGVLTEYGRSLSRELMSTWGKEGFENAGFGLIKETEKFRVGGDVRAVQTYVDNYQVKSNRFFMMQQNVELAFKTGKAWIIGTLGTQEGPSGTPDRGTFLSERHYVLIDAAENVTVRLGKFRTNFGLNDPNHTRVTKSPLGFGSLSETYNLEVGIHNEKSELFLTSSHGFLDTPNNPRSENSLAASYGHYIGEKAKVGASFLSGENQTRTRQLLGLWGIAPVGERGVLMGEIDYQVGHALTPGREKTPLLGGHVRYGYNVVKGVMPYVLYEQLQTDMNDSDTKTTAPGVGIQWLPIPHFEIQAEYQRQADKPIHGKTTDSAWLLVHFYL